MFGSLPTLFFNRAQVAGGARRPKNTPVEIIEKLNSVKTLRGITAPRVLRLVVTLRAKKCKNSSFARHYDQIRFRFRTASVSSRLPRCKTNDRETFAPTPDEGWAVYDGIIDAGILAVLPN